MTGIMSAEPSMTRKWILPMKTRASTIMMTVRKSCTSCSEMNLLMVFTSEVHRWMMSPVLFSLCHV